MTAFETIMNAMADQFTTNDEKYINTMVDWALGRKAEVKEFKNSPEYKEMDMWAKYDKLHNMCGGKTWYRIINDNNYVSLEIAVRKICDDTINARNAKIASKLEKSGVTEVVGEGEVIYSNDGFHGIFHVNTEAGKKRVKIETVLAGGYNVQCLHYRTLVNVK